MAAPGALIFLCSLFLLFSDLHGAAGDKATVSVKAVTAIAHTDDNFICATLDWWPRDKCNYGMCPWYDSSIINLVSTQETCVLFLILSICISISCTINSTDFCMHLTSMQDLYNPILYNAVKGN